jgi:hypothetical protein
VKVVFKPAKLNETGNDKKLSEVMSNSTQFHQILTDIVTRTKDPYLYQIYELIVNNRETNDDDVIFF